MADIVDWLIEERDLLDEIDIPFVPRTGRGTNVLVNEEPIHTDGSEMRMYEELSNGYYLYTALSVKSKKRYVTQLVERMDLNCEYFGDW